MIDTRRSGTVRSRSSEALTIALVVMAVGALLLRVVSIAEPIGIDQSLWASAVRGLSRGQLLYRDVWEQRPPGIYVTYLTAFRVLGWAASTIVWLDILSSAVTTLLLYALARALGGRLAAATAAALYAVLTMPAWLYSNGGFLERSVCETFTPVCVGVAAWCAVTFRERPLAVLAAGVGFFAGAAVVFKPNAGLYLPALLLWMVCYGPAGLKHTRSAVRPIGLALIASVILPVVAAVWLWRLGVLHDARVAVIDFNRFYVAQGFTAGAYALDFSKAVWLRIKTQPLWLAGSVGAVVALWTLVRTRRLDPLPALAIVWGGASTLVIVVNGARLFNSYFIQALPPLSLLAAWFLVEAARQSKARRIGAAGTLLVMLGLLVAHHYPTRVLGSAWADLDALLGRSTREAYLDSFGGYGNSRGFSARANEALAAYVRSRTTFDDRIFLFGISGAGVYFGSDRLTAQRFLRVNDFFPDSFPDPEFTLGAVLDDLRRTKPRYVIFERLHSPSEMGRAVDGLTERSDVREFLTDYRLETQIEDFTLYRRLE